MAGCKYPRQIAAVKRKEVTLSVEAELQLAQQITNNKGEEEQLPPLTLHSPWSRFIWTLVDTSGHEKVYPWANIPAREVGVLKTLTDAMLSRSLMKSKAAKTEQTRLAYSVKLLVNPFRGQTPAAVLLADPNQKEKLIDCMDFLRAHLNNKKFEEGNQKQIDAINDALDLFEAGELSKEEAGHNESVVIYHMPSKTLKNRPPKDERYFTYSIKIEYDIGFDYPWIISIHNAYMKLKEKSDGTFQTIPETAKYKSSSRIMLSNYEFGSLVDHMYNTVRNFETIFFRPQFIAAQKLYEDLRNSFQSSNEGNNGYSRAS